MMYIEYLCYVCTVNEVDDDNNCSFRLDTVEVLAASVFIFLLFYFQAINIWTKNVH